MNNIDWSKMRTAAQIAVQQRLQKVSAVKAEATRRIESRWDKAGQNNVALGLYTEAERQDCVSWINAHRAACQALIERADLLELDIKDSSLWP